MVKKIPIRHRRRRAKKLPVVRADNFVPVVVPVPKEHVKTFGERAAKWLRELFSED